MKKYSAFWWTVLAFGLINGYDVVVRFGWVMVDRPPTMLYLINLWTAVRNLVGYTLVPASLVFLLGRKSRWVLVPAFAMVLGIELACEYSARVFHAGLSDNWIALVTNTSFEEMVNFLAMSISWLSIVAVVLLVLIVVGYAVLMNRASFPVKNWVAKAIGVGLVCPFVITNMLTINWHGGVCQTIWSAFMVNSYMTWKNMQGIIRACDQPNLPDRIDTLVPMGQLPEVVIVIGESSTRNNWSLYGYQRHTTPNMEKLCADGENGIAMRDVVGVQPITVGAVSALLTDSILEDKRRGNWTLAEVYRRAGYRCVQISNQLIGEKDQSLLARLYNGCEKRICPRYRLLKDKNMMSTCCRSLRRNWQVVMAVQW